MKETTNRRTFLAVASALIATSRESIRAQSEPASSKSETEASTATKPTARTKREKEDDVGAVEDLMREHGVIRRVLVVYRVAATRLRAKTASVSPEALQMAAKLMRAFGEDYHERQLEEVHIFPMLMKNSASLAGSIHTLLEQHRRGRDITDYVLGVTQKAIAAEAAEPLARTLEAFALMYEEHAAFEDTIVFPAWKKVLTPKHLEEMGERFEEIERRTFGEDGFNDAVDRVGTIEKSFGIALAVSTAPPVKP